LKVNLNIIAAVAAVLASGLPALAHHSFAAEYDSKSKIELKGVVTKFEWTNPHAHFYVDVKDAAGKVVNWNLELASPNMMQRNGWTRHSLKEGDVVVVVASKSKDNTATASADIAAGRPAGPVARLAALGVTVVCIESLLDALA